MVIAHIHHTDHDSWDVTSDSYIDSSCCSLLLFLIGDGWNIEYVQHMNGWSLVSLFITIFNCYWNDFEDYEMFEFSNITSRFRDYNNMLWSSKTKELNQNREIMSVESWLIYSSANATHLFYLILPCYHRGSPCVTLWLDHQSFNHRIILNPA